MVGTNVPPAQNEKIYTRCRGAVQDLLDALNRNDWLAVDRELGYLEAYLAARSGEANSLETEKLDAIEALACAIRKSLERLCAATEVEVSRMRATGPLLRHLTAAPVEPRLRVV